MKKSQMNTNRKLRPVRVMHLQIWSRSDCWEVIILTSNVPTNEVEIRERGAPTKLIGGTVIDGFPGIGLSSTISSACLISSLNLSFVGELRSDLFPPLASVYEGQLQAPARIYSDAARNLSIFLGNFTPSPQASHAIARAMIRWAKEKECALVVTSAGFPLGEGEEEHEVSAVANGPKAEARLLGSGIPLASLAAIAGTAGSLLLEGREAEIPVVALIVKTHEGTEDFEAALKLAEVLAKIVPEAKCETEGLREEAQRAERALKRIRRETSPTGVYG